MKQIFKFIVPFTILLILLGCNSNTTNTSTGANTDTSSNERNASNEDTIKIGVLAPITGFMSTHGEELKRGAELSEKLINESGGIDGRKIEVIIEDTQSDPSINAEKARQLINQANVDFLIGTASSAETLAVVPIAEENGVPFIYSIDGELRTCAPGDKNSKATYVFGAGPTPQMLLTEFLPSMMEEFGDKVFFVGSDYVYPRFLNNIAEEIVEENGGTILGSEYAPSETTDYSAIITRVLDAEPDILFLTLPGTAGTTFVTQARQYGVFEQMTVTGSATFDTEAYSAIGSISEGVYVVNRYSELLENELNERFVNAYIEEYNPDYPIGPTASSGAYGVILTIKEAVEKAGTTDADAFVDAMQGLEVELPQGKIKVDPENHMFQQPIYIMQIMDDNYQIIEDLGMIAHPGLEDCSVE